MSTNNKLFLPPDQTRLVTICAHVDHGKTTLADNLIESNGIISERLAGTLRYLDSLEEEQRRGITMRASAIGLRHIYHPPKGKQQQQKEQPKQQQQGSASAATNVIVHLLDSPGHTDFSTEVSSSLQCCDGCLLVVDAVEGMCARTHQVAREAHSHQLVPILVINKVDRLCTNLCLSPTEAYVRLRTLIESVNATCAAMLVSKQADDDDDDADVDGQLQEKDHRENSKKKDAATNNKGNSNSNSNNEDRQNLLLRRRRRRRRQQLLLQQKKKQQQQKQQRKDESNKVEEDRWTFDPQKGNVIFASALYGWGFTVPNLSRSLFRNKIISIKPPILKQYLFGDYKYKNEKMLKWKSNANDDTTTNMPLFAEYGLRPIWDMYESVASAAAVSGVGSSLFADGRIINHQTNAGSKQKAKIQATTPGMDQVLDLLQIGSTSHPSAGNIATKTPTTINEIQDILTRTGSSTEESVLRSLLRRYRPLSDCVLDAVYEICPSPNIASMEVRPRALALAKPILPVPSSPTTTAITGTTPSTDIFMSQLEKFQLATKQCDISENNVPTIAHICKFMVTERNSIRDPALDEILSSKNINNDNNNNGSIIMGLARVLSGRLRTNDEYFVLGPKYQPPTNLLYAGGDSNENDDDDANTTNTTATIIKRKIRLYLLMGSSFVLVNEVPAGHLCAIQNLDDVQLKTATIYDVSSSSSTSTTTSTAPMLGMMPLRGYDHGIQPLVKVNVEAADPAQTPILERGLLQLSLADGAVEVTATAKGERILACLGELHLEQSILDLKRTYIGNVNGSNNNSMKNDTDNDDGEIELRISDPIVEFGETTDWFTNESSISNATSTTTTTTGGGTGAAGGTAGESTTTTSSSNAFAMDEINDDFATFYTSSQIGLSKNNYIIPPLVRQCTIPPYNEEEGIEYSKHGRSRTIISGRSGAISLRVVPLKLSIYQSLKEREVVDNCEDDLIQLAKVLGISKTAIQQLQQQQEEEKEDDEGQNKGVVDDSGVDDEEEEEEDDEKYAQADMILQILLNSICSIDDNGQNAIVETSTLRQGITARGVISSSSSDENNNNNKKGEIYIPKQQQQQEQQQQQQHKLNYDKKDDNELDDDINANDNDENKNVDGSQDYEAIRYLIRDNGFVPHPSSSSSQTTTTTSATTTTTTMEKEQQEEEENDESRQQEQNLANSTVHKIWNEQLRGSVPAGFKMAIRAGPICEEPVRGVLVILEGIEIAVNPINDTNKKKTNIVNTNKNDDEDKNNNDDDDDTDKANETIYKPSKLLSGGMIVSALRTGIRCALLTRPARLMESHLRLTLHSSLTGIGSLYSVLSKRRGKVLEDAMVEGTDLLMIVATLPHVESFGLAPELFRKSSGEVTAPELIFSHWERLDKDPFWIPTSLEEREDFGEILINGDVSTGMDNTALTCIRTVRQRKGLLVDSSRTVVAAEKQRTLKR